MKISIGERYRHISCLDMDIEIEKISYIGPNYVLLNLAYLNRNWQNGNFLIDREKNVRIYRKHFPLWQRIKNA